MTRKLQFGLQPPEDAMVAWGARAIFRRNRLTGDMDIDFVPNRQDAFGSESAREELFRWLDIDAMLKLRRIAEDLDPSSDQMVTISDNDQGYTLQASPRRSHGYLYIVAWKSGPKEWAPGTKTARKK